MTKTSRWSNHWHQALIADPPPPPRASGSAWVGMGSTKDGLASRKGELRTVSISHPD